MKKTITTTTRKSDVEIIADNNLSINSPEMVNDFLSQLNQFKMMVKNGDPTHHEQMVYWGGEFAKAYQETNLINQTTPLHYLQEFLVELNMSGNEVMVCIAYMPFEFQVLFGRYFVSKKTF